MAFVYGVGRRRERTFVIVVENEEVTFKYTLVGHFEQEVNKIMYPGSETTAYLDTKFVCVHIQK